MPPLTAAEFASLPSKARKRRRMGGAAPSENVPRGPSNEVGILPLDTLRLTGSQRVGIIGLPGMGKSTCCKSLLADLRYHYPIVSVCSGSEADNTFYSTMIPKLFIHNHITPKFLKQIINRQRLAIGHDSPLKESLLILDDCFESPTQLDNDMIRILFKHGRHLQAAVWVVQQYIVDLRPYARSTTSAVILFHCPSSRDRRLLFQNYGSVFPDFNTFSACYNAICSQPHTAMVILLNNGNATLLDSVFYYKPRLIGDDEEIKLCHPAVWEHARARTDETKLNELDLLTCYTGDDQ